MDTTLCCCTTLRCVFRSLTGSELVPQLLRRIDSCETRTCVSIQVTHAQAVAALAEAVAGAAAGLQGLRSGVVRFEVSLQMFVHP